MSGSKAAQFKAIKDNFSCLSDVQDGLIRSGLEKCELVLAVDLTKSNTWAGFHSFNKQSLHSLTQGTNPYQSVISIICKTLAAFDDDELIPTYGFGDLRTQNKSLLSFHPKGKPIHTLENVLAAYNALVPRVTLCGPTSFALAIRRAMEHVVEAKGGYHILVIIADGQISAGDCEKETIQAIVDASNYPLSIVMVGVGDGPWDAMETFDDGLPARNFDNFQFVNYTKLSKQATKEGWSTDLWESTFAVNALMEIPEQYQALKEKKLLGRCPRRFKLAWKRSRPVQVVVLPDTAAAQG